MTPWYQRRPALHRRERDALADGGFRLVEDEDLLHRGVLCLAGTLVFEGGETAVRIFYPDGFPFVRPEVTIAMELERHQSRYDRFLCLWPAAVEEWNWEEQWGCQGRYFLERARELLSLQSDPTALAIQSEPAPDRQSRYLFNAESMPVIAHQDTSLEVPAGSQGEGLLVLINNDRGQQALLRRLTVHLPDGTTEVRDAPPEWAGGDQPKSYRFSWKKLDGYPDFHASLDDFEAKFPNWLNQQLKLGLRQSLAQGSPRRFLGAAFPEEWDWDPETRQMTYQDAWVLVGEFRQPGGAVERRTLRAYHLGAKDRAIRVPELVTLGERSLAVIGTGAIGSSVAVHAARAGLGYLLIADPDGIELGNLVRGEFDLTGLGKPKVTELAARVHTVNPTARVTTLSGPWGGPRINPGAAEAAREFDALLEDADVWVVAVADYGVSIAAQEAATEAGVSLVWADVNNGAWGARIFRSIPGAACLGCLYEWMADHPDEEPVAAPAPAVPPRGCDSPTFTGTGFDVDAAATFAVRYAIEVITATATEDHNYIVFQSRGTPTAPEIRRYKVERYPGCTICCR